MKQVAKRATVSTATVSRVLSGASGVRDALSERVRAATRSLGYQPNRVARNLRVRTTRTIGVVIPDIENPFFTGIIGGIESVLQAADYSMLLAISNENPKREQTNLSTLRAEGATGIIFTPSMLQMDAYRQLIDARVPIVAVSRIPAGLTVDLVTIANTAGARSAVSHLIHLGHRRIGLVDGPAWVSTAHDREVGYEQAFEAAGLSIPRDVIQHTDFRQAGGYSAMQMLLGMSPPPTAVFAGNNLSALGVLQAIHERGLKIPSDIAVVGFGDMPWAASLQPPLTAVAQPALEVGVTAARMLLDRLREPSRPTRHIILETRLILRASC